MEKLENFISFEIGNVQSKNVFGGGSDDDDNTPDDSAGGWLTGEGGYLQPGEGGPNDYVRNGYY